MGIEGYKHEAARLKAWTATRGFRCTAHATQSAGRSPKTNVTALHMLPNRSLNAGGIVVSIVAAQKPCNDRSTPE